MEKKIFITYGDDNYKSSVKRIVAEARALGLFDEVRAYTPADLPEPFLTYTKEWRRGGGYWLWKPYIIHHELERSAEGDIVVYADAGCTLAPHKDWQRYFDAVEGKEELFFLSPEKNARRCKEEVFDFFATRNGAWRHARQVQATFIVARKSGGNEVISRWHDLALNHHELFLDTDAPEAQSPAFVEHRHDQAVLTGCVCTARKPRAYALKVEKLERMYATGQAVFASRISDAKVRSGKKVRSRAVELAVDLLPNPMRVAAARLLFAISRGWPPCGAPRQ